MSTSMPLHQPDGIRYERTATGLRISWRWFSWAVLFIAIWLTFWFSILGTFYFGAVQTGSIVLALFPTVHLLVGLYVAYSAAGQAFNTTKVDVALDSITVKTTPFPLFGHNNKIKAADIQQLYVVRHSPRRNKGRTFEVHALMSDYSDIRLVRRLKSTKDALFIEQEIEQYLELSDVFVPGSIPRSFEAASNSQAPDYRRAQNRAPVDSVRQDGPFDPQPPGLTDGP